MIIGPTNHAGHTGDEGRPPAGSPGESVPAERPAWISDTLLTETMQVWSEAYGRTVTEAEAIEMLNNVKRLGEALLRAKKGGG